MGTVILTGEVIVGLVALFLVVTLIRRRLIAGDAVPMLCALLLPGDRWHAGLLKITPSELQWFPLFGITARARHTWRRGALEVGATAPVEESDSPDAFVGVIGALRVDFTVDPPTAEAATFSLGLSPDGYTALRAWLEAGPPLDWRVET